MAPMSSRPRFLAPPSVAIRSASLAEMPPAGVCTRSIAGASHKATGLQSHKLCCNRRVSEHPTYGLKMVGIEVRRRVRCSCQRRRQAHAFCGALCALQQEG